MPTTPKTRHPELPDNPLYDQLEHATHADDQVPMDAVNESIHMLVHHALDQNADFICNMTHGSQQFQIKVVLKEIN